MTRNLKAMGLALFAVFALGAIGTQSASAVVEHSFTSGSAGGTILTATTAPGTKEKLSLTSVSIECTDVTYRGYLSSTPADHATIVPLFTDAHCTATGGAAATVTNNGCTYTFDSDTFENATHFAAGETHANVSLACNHPSSDTGSITIQTLGCTMHLGTTHTGGGVAVNHNMPGVRYTELPNHSGGKTAMSVSATVRTIKAETTGAGCPLIGLGNNGTHSNGTYGASGVLTGYEGPSYNSHTESPKEGVLVNVGLSTP